MDIKSIQKWLGHADEETTLKIYAKVKEKEAKNEVSEHLGDIIPDSSGDLSYSGKCTFLIYENYLIVSYV